MNIIWHLAQIDNPKKSKAKCMAFLKKKRTLKNMTLCGKKLPWVESAKHLGNTIVNNIDGINQDIEKRAQYITRNNELQEFSFAHPTTKCLMSLIHTSVVHHCGTYLITPQEKLKNLGMFRRLIFSLPRETHKYLIEPVSETKHKAITNEKIWSFLKHDIC